MSFYRICVLGPNKLFFGARLIQIPIFQHLKVNYPNARIRLYSPVQEADLFKKYSLVDEVVVYKKGSLSSMLSVVNSVRKFKPDLVINCREFSESSHLVVALSGRAFKIGFTPSTSLLIRFYTKTIPYSAKQYRAISYLQLVEQLVLKHRFGFNRILDLQALSSLSITPHPFVCLIPGGGEGENKRWGIKNFLDFCRLLIAKNPKTICYFVLGFMEQDYIEEIERSLPENNKAILFRGMLEDMIKVIGRSSLVVANDCGPSHLAQMMGVNYVSVWGWEKQDPYTKIDEWFHKRDNALYVVAEANKSIKTIEPMRVFDSVSNYLPS